MKRLVLFYPRSVREVRKYLRPPLSKVSAVLYFSEDNDLPFFLTAGGGFSAMVEYRLPVGWEPKKENLKRILIVTTEEHVQREPEPEPDIPAAQG